MKHRLFATLALLGCLVAQIVWADVPNRPAPSGMVPNPGTQQQELSNISATGPYNVFDFPNFCAGCHGGTIDPNVSHYGNWSGSNMANSARDPFFRANNLVVNSDAYYATGVNGVGNICWRCHSPNAWYSARMDETQGGKIDGSMIQQSMLASTDMQGITCEFCHRTVGNVTMQRADLNPNDPAWNMLSGATDWPHTGNPYPEGPIAGLPYGDTSFQFTDSKTYQADLPGNMLSFWSDVPTSGTYTGQTYGIYPPGYTGPKFTTPTGQPQFNALGEEIAYLPDGRSKLQFELPVGPPEMVDANGNPIPGTKDWDNQSVSPRHATHSGGSVQDGMTASGVNYLTTSEMCGTCHDLTVPTLNNGMPEQRTYTEWRFSAYGTGGAKETICQDCHMGEGQHEYKDGMAGTFKADPEKAGYFPYAKARPASAVHRFSPANRDLPKMLKLLNPDVDMEFTGKATGRDTRTANGVLSNRDQTWDRHARYGELKLRDAARIEVTQAPTLVTGTADTYEVKVKVTNLTGHALPSGYPDGRRAFITLNVTDANNAVVYQSGVYDDATATLKTSATEVFNRALSPVIDATQPGGNAVMVYEKRTGAPNGDGTYKITESLLNPVIVFDNRLRPEAWTADLLTAGVRLVNYSGSETAATPFNEPARYPVGQHWDEVTYRFNAPSGLVPTVAEARFNYQSHTREFVEYLKDRNNEETLADQNRTVKLGGPRPQGTPSILAVGYPNTPNYLGDGINLTSLTDLNGHPLMDNWGSLTYAAWMLTGKGAPFEIDADSTAFTAAPASPTTVTAAALDPFSINVSWPAVANAAGYKLEVRFGTAAIDPTTGLANASWEPLGIVRGVTSFVHDGLHVDKTYGYRVIAFNGKGESLPSNPAETKTPKAPPTPATNLTVSSVGAAGVGLQWLDNSIDETEFQLERQTGTGAFALIKTITIAPAGAGNTGPQSTTDTTVTPGTTYGYRLRAANTVGATAYTNTVTAAVPDLAVNGVPVINTVTAASATSVTVTFTDGSTNENSFVVERQDPGAAYMVIATIPTLNRTGSGGSVTFTDTTTAAAGGVTYNYRVAAKNTAPGQSGYSNVGTVTTPAGIVLAAPTGLTAVYTPAVAATATTPAVAASIRLNWTDASTGETGYVVKRATGTVNATTGVVTWGTAASQPTATSVLATDLATFADTPTANALYQYSVMAMNGAVAGPAATVTVVAATTLTPGATQLQSGGASTASSVRLQWQASTATLATGYRIESCLGTAAACTATLGTWTQVGAVAGRNTRSSTVTGLTTKTTYRFRVTAISSIAPALTSTPSNILAATTR